MCGDAAVTSAAVYYGVDVYAAVCDDVAVYDDDDDDEAGVAVVGGGVLVCMMRWAVFPSWYW